MSEIVSWSNFNAPLIDGDQIRIVDEPGFDPNQIEFILTVADSINWWKGLNFVFGDGKLYGSVGIQDHQYNGIDRQSTTNPIQVPADETLLRGARLELLKAKTFGVHTGMYYLTESDLLAKRGRRITFVWERD